MLSKRHNLALFLSAILAMGTVALAEQPGKGAAAPAGAPALGATSASTSGDGPQVGQMIGDSSLHRVTRPGLYGMSQAPSGSAYGIVNDRLIRFDPATGRLLSIIRQVDRILD